MQQHLNVTVVNSGESYIRAKDVPFTILSDIQSEPFLQLSGSSFTTKMEMYYFGDVVVLNRQF